MTRSIVAFAVFLGFFTINAASEAVEIHNFKSGLVCPVQPNRNNEHRSGGWICFETETVNITGQGRCVFDGEEMPCTWYGYEFDYNSAAVDDEIACVSTSSESGDIGNPEQIEKSDATTYQYSIKLEPGTGRYYNPQYSVFTRLGEPVVRDETICSVAGQELFRFQFQLIFPNAKTE